MRVFLLLMLFPYFVSGQNEKLLKLVDSSTGISIPQAHVQNLSSDVFTVTNNEGGFMMPLSLGDSLWISSIGYESLGVIVGQEWMAQEEIIISMHQDTIMLESVTVGVLPSEKIFKQRVLAHEPEPGQTFYGIEQKTVGTSILLEDKVVKSVGYAITHPFGFAYHNLSKKEKEKRKMHNLKKNRVKQFKIDEKFSREYVSELTSLKDKELTDFIAFCGFTEDFLYKSTQYQIAEAVMHKLSEFKNRGKG